VTGSAPLVLDIGLVLLLAAAFGWVARHLGLPAVVGYLVAGLAVSPFTPGYVADREQIALLADIGVVLLLFEVGIEVDVARLGREQRSLLWAAPLQVVVSMAIGAAAFVALGTPLFGALLVGLGVAMSSSVVIVNITRSRRRTTDPGTDRALLGWSVLQDVTGVAIAAIVLAVFGSSDRPLPVALGGLVVFSLVALGVARILPAVLRRLRWEHDLFLIVSVAVGLTVAALGTVVFGIPMALAAFVAGLAISESRETGEVRTVILPFRDVFAVLFFVAVGSLIDPSALGSVLPFTALVLVLVVGAKVVPAYLFARAGRLAARPRQLAVGLGQVGEFSYVLGAAGLSAGVLTSAEFSAILGAVVLSIAGSAVIVRRLGPSTGA
jgi:monovalent cation:H+ antiporter-2, CPA2 family